MSHEARPRSPRYFTDRHPELEALLDSYLAEMRKGVSEFEGEVEALVLAGGYGRGEGGVFVGEDGRERLYNDLEFYLFTRCNPSAALRHWVHETEQSGSRRLELDVEIRVTPAAGLRRTLPSMFFYDLYWGHRVIFGAEEMVREAIPMGVREASAIPLHEASRLLFNRGSGLLFSAARLSGVDSRQEAGFIQRNHAKLMLAMGDAWLTAKRSYHWSAAERGRILKSHSLDLSCGVEIQRLHEEGVRFKFHPRHDLPMDKLQEQQAKLLPLWRDLFLWIESRRLETRFISLQDYSEYGKRVLPEISMIKSFLCHSRDVVRHRGSVPRWRDYPRGTLQRALAAVLSREALDLEKGAEVLSVPMAEFYDAYRMWWSRYN